MTRASVHTVFVIAFALAVVGAAFCASVACLAGVDGHCLDDTNVLAQATLSLGAVIVAVAATLPGLVALRSHREGSGARHLATITLSIAPLRI